MKRRISADIDVTLFDYVNALKVGDETFGSALSRVIADHKDFKASNLRIEQTYQQMRHFIDESIIPLSMIQRIYYLFMDPDFENKKDKKIHGEQLARSAFREFFRKKKPVQPSKTRK